MDKLSLLRNKIFALDDLVHVVSGWRLQSQTVVFTNGCFDIMHRGHVEYLAQAASLGNRLVVGLNSDQSIFRLKGANRPIIDGYSRAELLASFQFIDAVVLFDEETPIDLITALTPDVLAKGGDYTPETIVGANVVTANGGRVEEIPIVAGYSTTNIINKISAQNS